MTLAEFSQIFALLAVQLRATDADEATVRGYFKAMDDLEFEFVAAAAQRLAKGAALNDQGEAWFPKAPEWRAMAAKVEQDRRRELDAVIRQRRIANAPLCIACEDTGWTLSVPRNRYHRCACRTTRQLEVLGRRPMPTLGDAPPDALAASVDVGAITTTLARLKGMA